MNQDFETTQLVMIKIVVSSCTDCCIFCVISLKTLAMVPEVMLALARGVSVSRSFSTSAVASARVFNAPKKFRPKEEEKEVKVKIPKGDLRGEVAGYREERIVLSDDGAIIACWHPQVILINCLLFLSLFVCLIDHN